MKIFLENNFMCLVTPENTIFHHHTTGKPPKHHHPRHHNNNNKIRDQRKKVKNQNHKQILLQKFQTRTRTNRCEWVRGATISLLSLCAWSENGETISMIGDWVRRGWVWTIGAVRSSCSDAIWLYSCSDKAIFLLFLSLSLSLLFSKAGNRLKWKWKRKSFSTVLAIFYGQPGNAFQFDPIWSNNQTPTFPENHFRNQFEAKTNTA